MLWTDSENRSDVKLLQSEKQLFPMDSIFDKLGKVTNKESPSNALFPIVFNDAEFSEVTAIKLLH